MRVECPVCLSVFSLPPDARTEVHRTPDGEPRLEVRIDATLVHRCGQDTDRDDAPR